MSFTLTTSNSILLKTGANVNSTVSNSGIFMHKAADAAEAIVSTTARFDFVSNYSQIATNARAILEDATSAYAAMLIINYDMSGYTNNGEATTMINILRDDYERAMGVIKGKEFQDFMRSV